MKRILILISIILLNFNGYSQNRILDSLNAELNNAKEDSVRLRIYHELGEVCDREDNLKYAEPAMKLVDKLLAQTKNEKVRKKYLEEKIYMYRLMGIYYSDASKYDYSKAMVYGEKMIPIYQELKDTSNLINAFLEISQYYTTVGAYAKGIELLKKGISISKEMNYKRGIALCCMNFGDIYRDQNEDSLALENYERSISILTEIHDTMDLNNSLSALGGFYYKHHTVGKALECYQKAIDLCEKKNDMKDRECSIYVWIGNVYDDNKDYNNALLNYQKSLDLNKIRNSKEKQRTILNRIGRVYREQDKFDLSLKYHYMALKTAKELNSEISIASTYSYLAQTYFSQNNYKKAKDYCDSSITILNTKFDFGMLSDAELLASQIDSANGNGIGAFQHYKNYVLLMNKLKGDEVHKAAQKEKYQEEYDKQKATDKAEQDKKDAVHRLIRNVLTGGLIIVIIFSVIFFRQRNNISKEKKRSDDLLLNILPAEVAEELKDTGGAKAKSFDEVTVMFTDFKGFTQISEKMSPEELVAEIDYCFKGFDKIIEKYGIEKIKTIGDSYMCAGGLPVKNKTHADDVVQAAIEINEFILNHKKEKEAKGEIPFEIRIGIHTGPVVAGIVGIKKFAYDIWGDTVNLASRMESSGEVGKVNISGSTYELVKDKFTCIYRGKIEAKHKGEVDMYFVSE